VGGGMFTDYSLPRGPMARRKSRMYKQVSNVHLETIADDDWSSFMLYRKQENSMTSAYIDKVRISWVGGENDTPNDQALMFVSSLDSALDSDTPSNNDGNIISATASRGDGGVVTLDVRRRITSNETQHSTTESTSGFPIYLHVRSSLVGEQTKAYLIVETFGRWFKADSL